MSLSQEVRGYSKAQQLYNKRIKPTQKQMGAISPKVRAEIKRRSVGLCEVRKKCNGALAVHMAHITGRKQLKHKTTAEDILHACLYCHKWLDEDPEGIAYKKSLEESK